MKKSKKKFSIVMLIFNIVSIVIILYIIHLLIVWNIENYKNSQLQQALIADANITFDKTTINNATIDTLSVDFNNLLEQNNDIVRLD